jgi:hypothetical protein
MNTVRLTWTTVGLVSATIVAATGSLASAQVVRVVSPPSAANAEGDTSVMPSRDPLRIQYLIPAEDFTGLPESHRYLVAFNFRSDGTVTQAVDWTMPYEQAWISTTDKESLTRVFDENHGADKTLVFDGTMTYPLLSTGPEGGPKDFADGTRFQTPFLYDPAFGNLLIELQDFDKNFPVSATVDIATAPPGSARALLLISDNPKTAAGTLSFDFVTIMQLVFVPEEDFNRDGQLTGDDINALASAVATDSTDRLFDLSGDGQVSLADVDTWLLAKSTLNGDADLDGTVQFADFVILANSYGRPGAWTEGDFDASGQVQFPDFTILANNFGLSAPASAAVPEPTVAGLLMTGLFAYALRFPASHHKVELRRLRHGSNNFGHYRKERTQ